LNGSPGNPGNDWLCPRRPLQWPIQSGRGFLLTKVIEQQSASPRGSDRIGNSLAGDIESRTMDGLEHRGKFALGVATALARGKRSRSDARPKK